jgi:C4-dicarboxylate-specific signal transduction histidine kinase
VTGALAIGIFIVDSITDARIAAGVLYVAVVLLSDRFCRRHGVLVVGLGCVLLTAVSLPLSLPISRGDVYGVVAISNAFLSVTAIGATTLLILRSRRVLEELQQTEAALTRVSRVTTVGALTAAIAHEVNQPLTGVVTSGNACLRWLAGEPPNIEAARRSVERIISDGERAGQVVSRIRSLVTKSAPQRNWLNINDVVTEVVALVGDEIRRNRVSLRTILAADVPLFLGDRVQLQQVILNLVMNAIEAMSGDGRLQRDLLITVVKDGPENVLVGVHDSGAGLEAAVLDRLFDALYTTKPNGMGMGLAISRMIIEAHGGKLRATPNFPQGSKFEFVLPTGDHQAP